MEGCTLGDGTWTHVHATTCWTIGLGEDQTNRMLRGDERVERASGELRGAREGDAQGALQAALRWRFLSFVRTRFCFSSER